MKKGNSVLSFVLVLTMVLTLIPQAFTGVVLADGNIKTVLNENDSGEGSFRQAVLDAQNGDIIEFDESVSHIITETVIPVNTSITIRGRVDSNGAPAVTLDGSGGSNHGMLEIRLGNIIDNVTVENLVITKARSAALNSAASNAAESITVNNCLFTGNTITSISSHRPCYVNDSSFINNVGGDYIIFNGNDDKISGTTFTNCLFSDNSGNSRLLAAPKNASIYMYNSRYINNKTTTTGTAPHLFAGASGSGGLHLYNSLIYGNTNSGSDAANNQVLAVSNKATLNLVHCTVTNNAGKIFAGGTESKLNIYNSIVTGNAGSDTETFVPWHNFTPAILGTSILQTELNVNSPTQIFGDAVPELDSDNNLYPLADLKKVLATDLAGQIENDLAGNPRPSTGFVTYGAFETPAISTAFVTVASDNGEEGSLRKVIEAAQDGDRITFAPGITEIVLDDQIEIPNIDLTIDGGKTVSIDGNNTASIFDYKGDGATLQLSGITFKNGFAAANGGAINAEKGNLIIVDCVFNGNEATGDGGAISLGTTDSTATITANIERTTFTGNSATTGGAIYAASNGTLFSHLYIDACYFENNIAETHGSAIRSAFGRVSATNSTFYGNINTNTSTGNGVISQEDKDSANVSIYMVHCTIAKNTEGIYRSRSSRVNLYNCIVTGNGTGVYQAANGNGQTSHGYVGDSTVQTDEYNNTFEQIFGSDDATPVNGCLMPSSIGTAAFDEMTAIPTNFASNLLIVLKKDQVGNTRIAHNGLVVAGSVYVIPQQTVTVTTEANAGPGSLREAVKNNAYYITFAPDVKKITLESEIAMYRQITIEGNTDENGKPAVTISGDNKTRVLNYLGPISGKDLILRNLTIADGYTNASNAHGAGVNSTNTLTVENCRFLNNIADFSNANGGAINSQVCTIDRSYFNGNKASTGGAIRLTASSFSGRLPQITNSNFINNYATGTTAATGGSAVYINNVRTSMTNCVFANNRNEQGSLGSILCSNNGAGSVTTVNCTFVNNDGAVNPTNTGGGISYSKAYNCIFVGNGDGTRAGQHINDDANIGGTNIFSNGAVNTFKDIFGEGTDVSEDGYIYPLASSLAGKGAPVITGTISYTPSNLLDIIANDSIGTPRAPINTFGAMALADNLTLFKDQNGKYVNTIFADGITSLTVEKVINNTDPENAKDCVLVIAFYNEKGLLEAVKTKVDSIPASGLSFVSESISLEGKKDSSYVSIFLVDKLDTIKPLYPVSNIQ